MNYEGMRSEIKRMTKQRYNWTGFGNPIGYTPSRKKWESPKWLQKKFLKISHKSGTNPS